MEREMHGLRLVDVQDERVLASLDRIRSMGDDDLRGLARDEHRAVVEAADAIIASRESKARETS
jgi:hypothetical protein